MDFPEEARDTPIPEPLLKRIIPEPKRKVGLIQAIIISNQAFARIPTFCRRCEKQITFKPIDGQGSFTRKCSCGCRLFLSHAPDKFHKTRFYTEKFIGNPEYLRAFLFDKNYKRKDAFERKGLTKTIKNGQTIYAKTL